MKSIALGLVMAMGVGMGATAQVAIPNKPVMQTGNPGIVMSGSQDYSKLPESARKFIERHFKGQKVTKCTQRFAKQRYEVELANGLDIDFDLNGKVREIEAPDNTVLSTAVVKELIHGKAYNRLVKDGIADQVEGIEFDKHGKAVEVEVNIPNPDVYIFDIDGNFIAIED